MSSGKVKCTCGWSWNKSDSSKKDMYICHECGRDNSNNMKNGGWLDQYADGGTMQEHQENYNDYNISAPEGYVGEGIFNGPIFENPAVKGQFQMGGSVYPVNYVPEAQPGGSFPGATGFSYARTGNIPSEGKYAKKTMASAQNGQEMQYYQQGLDFQPKTISKNGSQLDKAQPGTKKFKLKDDRDLITKPAESTNVKKKNFDLEQSKSNKTYLNQLAEQQKENKRRKALTQEQREREDYNVRNEQTGSIQAPVKESNWDRTKAIASNPLTAFGYAARNESLPTRFQYGERNALDTPIDFINPLQGVAALSEIPGELGRGEYLNAGLSALDAVDLGVYAKGAMKASKPLLQKAGRALTTEEGLLSNAYKLNPWAFKPNPEAYYRGIGESGYKDAVNSGVFRQAGVDSGVPRYNKVYYGSGNKGFATAKDYSKVFIAELPNEAFDKTYVKPNWSRFNLSTTEHVPINKGRILQKHWLQGYKEVPKQEDGGIIKDDRGQWAKNKKNLLPLQSNWLNKFE